MTEQNQDGLQTTNAQLINRFDNPELQNLISQNSTFKIKSLPTDPDCQQEHMEGLEEDIDQYKQLTNKLQTALKKISSTKGGMNKTMSHSLVHRFEECEARKQRVIEQKRQQLEIKKNRQIKLKPTINRHSQKLLQEVGYKPIYERFQRIVEEKKRKQQEDLQLKVKEQEQKEQLVIEELNKRFSKPQSRTYDQYYDEMVKWKTKKQEEARIKKEDNQVKQVEGLTFTPELNEKSKKMVASMKRGPIEQRGLVKKKVSMQYSFQPKINKRK